MNHKKLVVTLIIAVVGLLTTGLFFCLSEDHNDIENFAASQQQSEKAIIKFKNFTVAEDEEVHLGSLTNASSILIQVTSENPIKIDGTLSSKSPVKFIAQGGIIIGSNAIINIPQEAIASPNTTANKTLHTKH